MGAVYSEIPEKSKKKTGLNFVSELHSINHCMMKFIVLLFHRSPRNEK